MIIVFITYLFYVFIIIAIFIFVFIPKTALALGVLAALYALIALVRPRRLRTLVSHLGPQLLIFVLFIFSPAPGGCELLPPI